MTPGNKRAFLDECPCGCDEEVTGAGQDAIVVDDYGCAPVPKYIRQGYGRSYVVAEAANYKKTTFFEVFAQGNVLSSNDLTVEAQNPLVRIERHRAVHIATTKLHGSIVSAFLERWLLGARNLQAATDKRGDTAGSQICEPNNQGASNSRVALGLGDSRTSEARERKRTHQTFSSARPTA
jgi:hypothetical protein